MSELNPAGISKLMRLFTTAQAKNDKSLAMIDGLLTWVEEADDKVREEFGAFSSEVASLDSSVEGQAEGAKEALQQAEGALEATVARVEEATATVGEAQEASQSSLGESEEAVRERSAAVAQSFGSSGEMLAGNESQLEADGEGLRGSLDSIDQAAGTSAQQLDGYLSSAAEGFETTAEALDGEVAGSLRDAGDKARAELESQAGACEGKAGDLGSNLSGTYQTLSGETESAKTGLLEGISASVGQTVQKLIDAADGHLREPCERMVNQALAPTQDGLGRVLETASGWSQQTADFSGATGDIDRGHQAKQRLDAVGD